MSPFVWRRSNRSRTLHRRPRRLAVEGLESRHLLDGMGDDPLEPTSQYIVNHSPRLQLGNAPLAGTPAFDGFDQVEILWQTTTIGDEDTDSFRVEFRRLGDLQWNSVALNPPLVTNFNTRIIHSATLRRLEWNTFYEYRVHHLSREQTLQTYGTTFVTRLPANDPAPFSFATYGDSASLGVAADRFHQVQAQINRIDPDFAVLLGDNFYDFGSHREADSRFDPTFNEPATQWNSHKIDYFAIGNHDRLNRDNGQASRDNFSVPIQVKDVNAYATPPGVEYPEHHYSFDYGDVHFVTFDSNTIDFVQRDLIPERLEAQLDYVVADLKASTARWKIVFAHHPILGTEKLTDEPSGVYFQTVISRLRDAGADLFMSGHSHTYAWTYPLTGFADDDNSGEVTAEEVKFIGQRRHLFRKGDGLVELVAGVGGRSIRSHPFPDPFIARGFSSADTTGPAVDGFAHVQVTSDRLTVSYRSAQDGSIVGDLNRNGRREADEPFFGQFVIVTRDELTGDLVGDGRVNAQDIDALCHGIRTNEQDSRLDLDGSGFVDVADLDYLVRFILETDYGDANLDGQVNSGDLVAVFRSGQYADGVFGNSGWAEGDFDCDAEFDSSDIVRMFRAGSYNRSSTVDGPSRSEIAAALVDDEDFPGRSASRSRR